MPGKENNIKDKLKENTNTSKWLSKVLIFNKLMVATQRNLFIVIVDCNDVTKLSKSLCSFGNIKVIFIRGT